MLDGDGNKDSWWTSWIQAAKEKSETVYNFVKHDISEFTTTMQSDVAYVKEKLTQENATAASEKVKNILGGLSKALIVRPADDDAYSEMIQIVEGKPVIFDRIKARLHALQVDPATYMSDPNGTLAPKYNHYVTSEFNLEDLKGEISDLLVSNVHTRSIYTQLVPVTVSNMDFWRRYFFRKRQLDEEELRLSQIIRRAEDTQIEDLGWDEEYDDSSPKFQKSTGHFDPPLPSQSDSNQLINDSSQPESRNDKLKSTSNQSALRFGQLELRFDQSESRSDQSNLRSDSIVVQLDSEKTVSNVDNDISINKSNIPNNKNKEESIDEDEILGTKIYLNAIELKNELKSETIIETVQLENKDIIDKLAHSNNEAELIDNKYMLLNDENSIDVIHLADAISEEGNKNEKPILVEQDLTEGPLLVDKNLNGEPLLVENSSSASPTSWTNLSNERNSKEENSPESSPADSDKSDGLADDWEKDFDSTLASSSEEGGGTTMPASTTTKSTVHVQILSSKKKKVPTATLR